MTTFNKAKRNKKWYLIKTKNYNFYIWFLPVVPFVIAFEKFNKWIYNHLEWSEKKATKILDKVLPKCVNWIEEEKAFYYCMGWDCGILWTNTPLLNRKWARKFAYELHQFVENGYENENYIKTIINDGYDSWVKFTER